MFSELTFDGDREDRPSLVVRLHRTDAEPPRMFVVGEVDALSALQLQDAVEDVLRDLRPGRIEIDVEGVTFLDSAGISALVQCHAQADQLGCRLRLANPQRSVYRVLQICGLLDHFGLTSPQAEDASEQRCRSVGSAD